MTLLDAQQQRLLERLGTAGDQPVAFAVLHAAGIDFPAAIASELELNGYVIERVNDNERLVGVRLPIQNPGTHRLRTCGGPGRTDSQPRTRRDRGRLPRGGMVLCTACATTRALACKPAWPSRTFSTFASSRRWR